MTTTREGFFASDRERQILDNEDVGRALKRIAHEIIERNRGAESLVLVGLHTRGVPLAQRLAALIARFENLSVPVGELDISLHRDDGSIRQLTPGSRPTHIPIDLTNHRVVLVDDVICTGRSVRAALDALVEHGRPRVHPVGGAHRPGAPRAAHPARLRGQKYSHRAFGAGAGSADRSGRRGWRQRAAHRAGGGAA